MVISRCRRSSPCDAEAIGSWDPPPLDTPYGLLTFGAQFARVAVDADLGLIRVRHMVGAFAPGRILNPKTARSQLMGGMLWGMSQALLEGNHMDAKRGRWASTSLGDYLVPVNADARLKILLQSSLRRERRRPITSRTPSNWPERAATTRWSRTSSTAWAGSTWTRTRPTTR